MAKINLLFIMWLHSVIFGNINGNDDITKIEEDYYSHGFGFKNLLAEKFTCSGYRININNPRGKLLSCEAFQLINNERDNERYKKYDIMTDEIFAHKGEDKNCSFEFRIVFGTYLTKWLIRTKYHDNEIGDWDFNDNFFQIENIPADLNKYELFQKVKDLNDQEFETLEGNKKIIDAKINLPLDITTTKIDGKIENCYIIEKKPNNRPKIYNRKIHSAWKSYNSIFSDRNNTCSLYIDNLTRNNIGMLAVVTYYHDNKENSKKIIWDIFRIRKIKEIEPFPSFLISKNPGDEQKIIIRPDFISTEICTIYHEKKEIKSYVYAGEFDESEDIKQCKNITSCCFKIKFNFNTTGNWLIEKKSNFLTTRAPFQLRVIDINSKKNHYKLWKRNSREKILMDSYVGFRCELHRLYDSEILVNSTDCEYSIENVSMSHAGKFLALYYVGDPWNYIEEEYTIEIQDDNNITVGIDETERSINIICKGAISEDIEKCVFKQLNGTVATFSSSEKNNKYEFFGTRWKNQSIGKNPECGMKINNPNNDDYKKWNCYLYYSDEKMYKSEIVIQKYYREIEIIESNYGDDNYECRNMIIGQKFEIQCNSAHEKTNYCQIQSPTLDHYYNNSTNGNCIVTIENASYNHTGNWTCIYHPDKKSKIKKIIPVIVRDEVTASITEIDKPSDKKLSTLACKIHPDEGRRKKNCQWIHPKNKNIFKDQDKYEIFQGNCTIRFEYAKENIGTWTCIVQLDNCREEYVATFDFIVNKNSKGTEHKNEKEWLNQKFSVLIIVSVFIGLLLFLILILAFIYYYNSEECPLLTQTNDINDEDL